MGYYDIDDYIEEPRYPEVDEMLDSVRKKIKEQLSKDVTDEVIMSSDIYKECQETIKKLRQEIRQKDTNLDLLGTLVTEKNNRLNSMRHACTYVEYSVGDECWIVKANSHWEITCPYCEGKGKVKVQIAEGTIPKEFVGERTFNCPKCNNETYYWKHQPDRKIKSAEFISYIPCKGKITHIMIDLNEDKTKNTIHYFAASNWGSFTSDKVFSTKEEAEEASKQMNIEAYNEAAFETGNEKAKDYDDYINIRTHSTCTRNL